MNSENIKIINTEVLSNNWYVLRKVTYDYLKKDGAWERQSRETYDRGNGVTILLYNSSKKTVILTPQNGASLRLVPMIPKASAFFCLKRKTAFNFQILRDKNNMFAVGA
jgi:hypothetical protein